MKDNIIEFLYPKNTKPILENTLPIKAVQNIPDWFKKLSNDYIKIFLRSIFPKFFLIIILISLLSLIIAIIFSSPSFFIILINFMSLALGLLCYSLIPITNKSKDQKNEKLFKLLHKISVVSTLIILLINFLIIFLV